MQTAQVHSSLVSFLILKHHTFNKIIYSIIQVLTYVCTYNFSHILGFLQIDDFFFFYQIMCIFKNNQDEDNMDLLIS